MKNINSKIVKIIFIAILLFTLQINSAISQCTSNSQYGSGAANNSGVLQSFSAGTWAGEWFSYSNVVVGNVYSFTINGGNGNFITIRQNNGTGTLVSSGLSPLTGVISPISGILAVVIHTSSACGTESQPRTIVANCSSCGTVQLPGIPLGVSATANSSSQITVNWSAVSGATSYQIDRATNSTFTSGLVSNLTSSTNSFISTGLSASTQYFYRVRAVNTAGISGNSTTANATTQSGTTIPSTPTGVAATANSSSQITVNWAAVSGATSYQIDLATNSLFTAGLVSNLTSSTNSFISTGLSASTQYFYRVRAANSAGVSANSSSASATTQSGITIPSTPTGVAATANSSSQITVNWAAVSGATSYQIDLATNSLFTAGLVSNLTSSTNSFISTGLSASTQYFYRVRAANSVGASGNSATANTTTQTSGSGVCTSGQPVIWTSPVGVEISGNNLTKTSGAGWSNGGAASAQPQILSTNATGFAQFTVGSISNLMFGLGSSNPDASYTSIDFAIHLRPDNSPAYVLIYENGSQVHSSPTPYIIGDVFRVERIGFGTNNSINYSKNGTVFYTSTKASNTQLLVDATLFETSSVINNAMFCSSQSLPSAPSIPTSVVATSNSNSQITVTWAAVAGATSYQIDLATNSSFSSGLVSNITSSSTSFISSSLASSTTYFYRVRALNSTGASGNSTTASATTQASGGGTGGTNSQWTTEGTGIFHFNSVHIGKSNALTGPENDYKLFVVGGIKTDKYKLEIPVTDRALANGWADYVFNKDYKLMPINQLKTYIDKNKHLPNFPSTKEILKEGGYEMGDMIRRQQEAIEHLHLYIIELEKRIKVLENKAKNVNVK